MVLQQPAVGPAEVRTFAVDLGLRHERDADALVASVLAGLPEAGSDPTASTHQVGRAGSRHVAVALTVAAGAAVLVRERLLAAGVGAPAAAVLAAEWADPDAKVAGRVDPDAVAGGSGHGDVLLDAGTPDPQLVDGARQAALEHRTRSRGRVLRFPGWSRLVGEVTVEQVLASAIDRVVVLAGVEPVGTTRLVTRDFVVPRWEVGQLVLHTQPNRGGTLVPFETPNPTPCCQDHALPARSS